jgi:hypothetical protein
MTRDGESGSTVDLPRPLGLGMSGSERFHTLPDSATMLSAFGNMLHAGPDRFEHDDQEPLWAELFSAERLEQHARSLAAAQPIGKRPPRWRTFQRRNADNADVLRQAY